MGIMFSLGWKLNMKQWEVASTEPPYFTYVPRFCFQITYYCKGTIFFGLKVFLISFQAFVLKTNKTGTSCATFNMLVKFAFISKKHHSNDFEMFLFALLFYLDHSEPQRQTLDYLKSNNCHSIPYSLDGQ